MYSDGINTKKKHCKREIPVIRTRKMYRHKTLYPFMENKKKLRVGWKLPLAFPQRNGSTSKDRSWWGNKRQ